MQNVLIIGGGIGGTAILKLLLSSESFRVQRIVDINQDAPAIQIAKKHNIPTGTEWQKYLSVDLHIIFDLTGSSVVFEELLNKRPAHTVLIPGALANMLIHLLREKDQLIQTTRKESHKQQLIFNSIEEGMIGIDANGKVNFFNKSANRMTGISVLEAIGKPIYDIIPSSELPRIFETGRIELNRELVLNNGLKIVASRFPIIDEKGERIGAFAVFKDISELVNLAGEITNLKEIQTMLQAIIHSSDDAISVVDEDGKGLLINPAYTRITGLETDDIIGKPATTDISEGESMHLKVLQMRKPIRGVNMRVGPLKREVIVNVAPIIVNNRLKGSVGVIHDITEIRTLMKELDRARSIIRTLESKYTFDDIIGDSSEMRISIEQAKLAANTPVTVLLRGESGTGKELFAHAIHSSSDRKYNKFIRVNCAAIAEHLLESELFGYEEGAFTGAKRGGKRGLFEEAHHGSIFLDEIGELSSNTQATLLRVLQENEIVRVGGTKSITVDVRVIAATNINMEKAMLEGKFREDLYYRLNRMPIQIPPLRNHKQDITAIAERLLVKLNQEYGRNVVGISEVALQRLRVYSWPGNVRELENIISRGIIFMKPTESILDDQHLPLSMLKHQEQESNQQKILPLVEQMERMEQEILSAALKSNDGNKSKTAKQLGVSLRTLYYKLEKYDLT
ncbi:sigma-54-dependent Fis family transcriptional regulator [Paenisporosarcina sp. TG20]|uniref:sigma-54 interaction domain-containing protein n=1 Tax=Paenisporosarcina sp. TG20 TaxID=1211706 RepID=UPI0002FD2E55|nr:sigma-54-dependent Fis family transcriptional regulator [Paenisporosarcina sp. TG20]